MIKEDAHEIEKMKEALGEFDKTVDPTVGAGMSMDQLMEKLMAQNNIEQSAYEQPQDIPPAQPANSQPAQNAPINQNHELKKIIKIKKPINPDVQQAVPTKNEVK